MKLTVKQLAATRPYLTEGSLRWMLFHRDENGLATAVYRIGRKLLIDEEKYEQWENAQCEAAEVEK